MTRLLGCGLALVVLMAAMPVRAATITYKTEDNINGIFIVGNIVKGDAAKIEQITFDNQYRTGVFLKSDGGALLDGLVIGEIVRQRHYDTIVPSGAACASVCGYIWLAGTQRYVGETGHIGFHAAYVVEDGEAKEVGQGNALVGAYLSRLGFSYALIAYVTSAPPQEVTWMHGDDARKLGVAYTILKEDPAPPTTLVATAATAPVEQMITNRVVAYYAACTGSGTDVEALADFYADTINFYGSNIPSRKVLDEKRRFAARWPQRHYVVKPSSVYVQCSDSACSVTGVVEWDVTSIERNVHSTGAANFVLKFAPKPSGVGVNIVSENGSVLSRHNSAVVDEAVAPTTQAVATGTVQPVLVPQPVLPGSGVSPARQAASATAAYGEGRSARIAYEQWYSGLVEGPYRDGVEYWAAHRSVKPAPACDRPGAPNAWQRGCVTAHERLAPIDLRRKAEKDFWYGWNSL